ncbi:MAG: DUF2867 domain-containing protein [Snodgrassella sp.]|nr:DUF2867 domain-containing protein [Snodgrassella sp.]
MNAKQKGMVDQLNALLSNITFVAQKVDYLSYQCITIPKNISAYDAYRMMTCNQPQWIELLFRIRDFLGKMVGIRPIKGFNKLGENEPDIGQKVHFFSVAEKKRDTLTLVVRDFHLDVCVHIRLVDDSKTQNKLYLITSVKNHHFVGKLYMMPVSVLHPYIVRKLFKNINVK